MPPEVCDPDVGSFSGRKTDIWALGVTLFAMVFNRLPFLGQNEYFVMENIRTQPVEFPTNKEVSPELSSLILFILEKSPQKRPSID